jgi:hypothetical protein
MAVRSATDPSTLSGPNREHKRQVQVSRRLGQEVRLIVSRPYPVGPGSPI